MCYIYIYIYIYRFFNQIQPTVALMLSSRQGLAKQKLLFQNNKGLFASARPVSRKQLFLVSLQKYADFVSRIARMREQGVKNI